MCDTLRGSSDLLWVRVRRMCHDEHLIMSDEELEHLIINEEGLEHLIMSDKELEHLMMFNEEVEHPIMSKEGLDEQAHLIDGSQSWLLSDLKDTGSRLRKEIASSMKDKNFFALQLKNIWFPTES